MSIVIPDHRRRRIMECLAREGSVRVSEMAQKLVVAEETIRRDLRQLEMEGAAIRTHGGAVPASGGGGGGADSEGLPTTVDLAFSVRLNAMAPQKRAIAALGATLIKPKFVIALDGSTTAWELARILPKHPLTVVTNSLVIINLLAARGDVRIVCTGGRLNPALQTFEGLLTHEALGRMNIDLAFFSCRGIDPVRGYSDPSEASASYKQRLIELAGKSVLLADHTKFGTRSVVNLAGPGKIHTLITDSRVTAGQLRAFERQHVTCLRTEV